jgi:hypothetical protein
MPESARTAQLLSQPPAGRTLTVEIFHDPDVESPSEDGSAWQLHSFSRRRIGFRDPEKLFPGGKPGLGLRNKLNAGTAWMLSYYQHGPCRWMLADEPRGVLAGDWRWDGVDVAGVLVWPLSAAELGLRTLADRRADAAAFLESYTDWCNGETFGYALTDQDGHATGGSCGLIGTGQLTSALLADLTAGDRITEVHDPRVGLTPDDLNHRNRMQGHPG